MGIGEGDGAGGGGVSLGSRFVSQLNRKRILKNGKPNLHVKVRVEYAYSCRICLLEFFVVFKLKNNLKNSIGQFRRPYAFAANDSTLKKYQLKVGISTPSM